MDFDPAKVDEAVLAVLFLTTPEFEEPGRAWKNVDWGATDRLFAQGLIENPRMTGKSILFTPDGLERARAAAARLLTRNGTS